jgi:hypothetical protein
LDLHYLAKAEDLKVSYHCVHRTLKLIVASGLATEISAGDATQYQHELAQCTNEHLMCKDCGGIILAEGGQHAPVEQTEKESGVRSPDAGSPVVGGVFDTNPADKSMPPWGDISDPLPRLIASALCHSLSLQKIREGISRPA